MWQVEPGPRRKEMIGKLIGKLVVWGLLSVVIGVVSLGGFFYIKAGQPMQVAAAQRLAPGITYREFWADRIQRWTEIDDQNAAHGKGRACAIVPMVMQPWLIVSGIMEVNYVRSNQGTEKARQLIREINGIIPPDDLIYGPWWKLPDAWWWQIENGTWFHYYRSLARAWNCEVGAPHKPTQE
jgi:hypothetical protein